MPQPYLCDFCKRTLEAFRTQLANPDSRKFEHRDILFHGKYMNGDDCSKKPAPEGLTGQRYCIQQLIIKRAHDEENS